MEPGDEYRRIAAECLHLAAVAIDPALKPELIAMAGRWMQLSRFAEKYRAAGSPGGESAG
jgi:hypothetical protein